MGCLTVYSQDSNRGTINLLIDKRIKMACTRPILAYRSKLGRGKNGKWPIVFNLNEAYKDLRVDIPCGRCVGCRLEKSRQWAIRCVNEAQLYDNNCFVTLTYDEDHVSINNSLDKTVMQKFIKKVRKKYGANIRYYLCGEYGDDLQRPHYHLCLFNHDFADKYLYVIRDNTKLYRSEALEKIWTEGYSTIGELTFESAAYVARYVTKKITGEPSKKHYNGRVPEFALMSRKPGLGKAWYTKYKNDVESTDKIIIKNSLQIQPPKYYDSIAEDIDIDELNKRKLNRRIKICKEPKRDLDEMARLDKVRLINSKQKSTRSYENGDMRN